MPWRDDPATVRPMLASTGDAPLDSSHLAYEPKYDGVRALVSVDPRGGAPVVRLWSRLGNEKTRQFPEIVEAFVDAARRFDVPVLLDGEIVAIDEHGEPAGFQSLQGRVHLKTARPAAAAVSVAFVAFDLLRSGDEDLRALPLRDRRARLETLMRLVSHPRIRVSEQAIGDGRPLFARAQAHGWEGLVAKHLGSAYTSGRRSREWCKLKLVRRQACVVGGWTEPRGTRPFFGALLLGVHDERGKLDYIGHTGAGFTDAELGRLWKRLHALETRTCPFSTRPRTNERPHWIEPKLVVEVKFTEWTADRRLRHPTYLGLRDDVKPETVRKEPDAVTRGAVGAQVRETAAERRPRRAAAKVLNAQALSRVLEEIDEIADRGGKGVLHLPGGGELEVTNLGKVFWPKLRLTKGDLLRHYVRVAPHILPVLADRPLVMKRYPNGIGGRPFYQHRAPDPVPVNVRVATVSTDAEERVHVVGGTLKTLLYTAQLASISQDPWFSRVGSEDTIDHVAIDLDPPEEVPFRRVLDVARWVRDELDALGAQGFAKTSGAGGLHVYVPMPPDTPYEAGLLFAQIVATMVARKHSRTATVERSIAARGRRIYVDYLQNIQGKTLASAYSARASEFAGVSTPLTWAEVEEGVTPRDFTLKNFAERLAQVGDLWAGLAKAKGADLRAVMKYAEP